MKSAGSALCVVAFCVVSGCGSSSGGGSQDKKQCPTPNSNAVPTEAIVLPRSQTPSGTNPTASQGTGASPSNASSDCAQTPNPIDLQNDPQASAPGTSPGTAPGTTPGTSTGSAPGPFPTANLSSLLGSWDFRAVLCADGSIPPDFKKINEMHQADEFYASLTFTGTGLSEYRWIKLTNSVTAQTMMCTMTQISTLSANGEFFRVSTYAAAYESEGGDVACNLPPEPAVVFERVGFFSSGDALSRTLPNSPACGGKDAVQVFEKRSNTTK